MFKHPSEELKEAVSKQIEMFDADDPYWKVSRTCILVADTRHVFVG